MAILVKFSYKGRTIPYMKRRRMKEYIAPDLKLARH